MRFESFELNQFSNFQVEPIILKCSNFIPKKDKNNIFACLLQVCRSKAELKLLFSLKPSPKPLDGLSPNDDTPSKFFFEIFGVLHNNNIVMSHLHH